MDFFWDLHQQRRIDENARDAARGQAAADRARDEVARLQDRVDRLVLCNMAMWTLLRDKLGLTDKQLEYRVRELDLSDGTLDGKMRPGAWDCPKCKRPNSPKHAKCIYCGHEKAVSAPFPV